MIERITVVKTFCLGRLSFVASFMCVKEEDIKEKIIRKTLIMPYEKGGLNMISLRAKIETILFQQFKYFISKIEIEYFIS